MGVRLAGESFSATATRLADGCVVEGDISFGVTDHEFRQNASNLDIRRSGLLMRISPNAVASYAPLQSIEELQLLGGLRLRAGSYAAHSVSGPVEDYLTAWDDGGGAALTAELPAGADDGVVYWLANKGSADLSVTATDIDGGASVAIRSGEAASFRYDDSGSSWHHVGGQIA